MQLWKNARKVLLQGALVSGLCLFLFVGPFHPNNVLLASSGSGARVLDIHFERMNNYELLDSSGYGHHGTARNGAAVTEYGYLFNGLELDGVNDYVDGGDSATLRLDQSDFTISAWVRLERWQDPWGSTIFFEAGDCLGSCYEQMVLFAIRPDGDYRYTSYGYLFLGFYGGKVNAYDARVPLYTWTHVTVTYQRDPKYAQFYINGDWKDDGYSARNPNFWFGLEGVRIGKRYLEGAWFDVVDYKGKIGELHVYTRLLSDPEVDYIYTQEVTRAGWQYGVSMAPPKTEYTSVEMPTSGMFWTSPPVGTIFSFWVSATTGDGVFAQNGFIYNGRNTPIVMPIGPTSLPAHSWGMFWTYYKPGVGYVGDIVLPPAGWSHTDNIYFSIAVYPSSNCLSFMFLNTNKAEDVVEARSVVVNEFFTGNVGGIAESRERSGLGDIYVDRAAIWAQDPGERVVGPGYVYDGNTSPYNGLVLSIVRIYKESDNIVDVGFQWWGQHYPNDYLLWSISYGTGEEAFPPCP